MLGLVWALVIGLVGGLAPAIRAAFAAHQGAARHLNADHFLERGP